MSYTDLSLLEFQRRFSTEADCAKALELARWPNGFVCPRCAHGKASRVTTRNLPLLQCAACGYQASLTAGTILHKTRTPLVKWYWAIWLVAQDKGGVSAMRLSKHLEISYRTAWTMLHKLRKAMGQRDARYTLTGSIEMDEAYIGGRGKGRTGRGTGKTPVVVMVENRGERAGFIGIKTVTSTGSRPLSAAAVEKIAPGQEIRTDGWVGYSGLQALGYRHHAETTPGHQAHEKLPWVHIAISNAKRFVLGTYHGVSFKYLQAYLDEYCYRFNRRSWEPTLATRLLTACLTAKPVTLAELKA